MQVETPIAEALETSAIYYGDNLDILQHNYIPRESINLIYLDPPFNGKADYNVLFKEPTGERSYAQIQAFTDFWHWDLETSHVYDRLTTKTQNEEVTDLTKALFEFLHKNDMMAYLVMMAERLLELHKVLKPTGSLFLHCDTTASHYLKLYLDAIFGPTNFRNEIVWKRIPNHSDARRFGRVADRILFYSKTDDYVFNKQTRPRSKQYLDSKFTHYENGRQYTLSPLNPPGGRGPIYEFHGITRPWRFTKEKMLRLEEEGRIYTKSNVPRLIRYLDELEAEGGAAVHEIWDDKAVFPVNSMAKERMHYPTQKPVGLLERIIKAGSDEGDWILDPFCGCGTAIIAAEKTRRHWIGIDITYLAIDIVKARLKREFPDARFNLEGEPKDVASATALAERDQRDGRYQFQWWAVRLIGATPHGSTVSNPREGKRGPDRCEDGWLNFPDGPEGSFGKAIVQVKSGHVSVKDIRELRDTLSSRNAAIGLFITLQPPTREMEREADETAPYISPRWGGEYPRIQILTIEGLLTHKQYPRLPPGLGAHRELLSEVDFSPALDAGRASLSHA
jgi:DNA modification methylase